MLLISNNKADIDKYYRNTYVKFSSYSEYDPKYIYDPDTLFYIEKVKNDGIFGKLQNGDIFEIMFDDESPLMLNYPLPHKSYFQHDGFASMLARIPARQYKRGISHENTRIICLKSNGNTVTRSVDFESLSAYVKKPVFSRLSIHCESSLGEASISLSPRMAYVPAVRQLYVDNVPVAIVEDTQIKLIKRVFKSEIEALLQRDGDISKFKIKE